MKKFLTKRNILYLVNAIFFLALVIFCSIYLNFACTEVSFAGKTKEILILQTIGSYLLEQCKFTLLTLIIYFLAVMASALNKKYKEQEKDNQDKK